MSTTKIPIRTVYDGSDNPTGLAEFQTGEVVPITHGGTAADTVTNAKINLSLTDSNIRSLFSVAGSGSYDSATGVFTVTGGVESVGGFTGNVSNTNLLSAIQNTGIFTTANVTEVTNLYYTNSRVQSYVEENVTTADISENNNLYFTEQRARDSVSAEGSINYDNTSGVFSFTQGNTDTITEGVTNLFYTNNRTRSAFTAGNGIQISDGTISVATSIDYGLIDGALTASNDYGSI